MNYHWYHTILIGAFRTAPKSCRPTLYRQGGMIFKLPVVCRLRPPQRQRRRSRKIGMLGPLRRWQRRRPGVRTWGHWSIKSSIARSSCAGRLNGNRQRLPANLALQGWLRRRQWQRPRCPPSTSLHSRAWPPFSAVISTEKLDTTSIAALPGREGVTAARGSHLAVAAGVGARQLSSCSFFAAFTLKSRKNVNEIRDLRMSSLPVHRSVS